MRSETLRLIGPLRRFLRIVPWMLLFPGTGGAQEPADSTLVSVELEVIDQDSGDPVENAVVRIPGLDTYLITDSVGHATLAGIPTGSYRLILTRMGYQAERGTFTVDRAGSFRMMMKRVLIRRDSGPGGIVGQVTIAETGDPLQGAVVSIPGTGVRQISDARGWFALQGLPARRHLLQVEYLGRQTLQDSVLVQGGQTLEVAAPLPVEAIELEGMTVTSHSSWLTQTRFFQRRKAARAFRGRQWTSDELEDRDPLYLHEVLTEVTGIRRAPPGAFQGTKVDLMGTRGCRLAVYVDDFRMDSWFDLDGVDPRRVEALEVYHGSPMPGAYFGHCGVILVWLKRR